MNYVLSKHSQEAGHQLRFFDELGSTNDEAILLKQNNVWVVTNTQTNGRGRQNRAWLSPSQNLACSFVTHNLCETRFMPHLSFVAGLAMLRALHRLLPFEEFKLKWPNDILLKNAKLCGILIEASSQGAETKVVLGWGVNITHSPQDLPYKTAHLEGRITREELFNALTHTWLETLALWQKGQGFENLKNEWLLNAAHLNQTITFQQGDETLRGIFVALTPQGGVRLKTEFGIKELYAGEIIEIKSLQDAMTQ